MIETIDLDWQVQWQSYFGHHAGEPSFRCRIYERWWRPDFPILKILSQIRTADQTGGQDLTGYEWRGAAGD